jgi:hypothetical protein
MSHVSTLSEASATLTGVSSVFSAQTNVLAGIKEAIENAISAVKETDGVLQGENQLQFEVSEYLEGYIGMIEANEGDSSGAIEAKEMTLTAHEDLRSTAAGLEAFVTYLEGAIEKLNEFNQQLGRSYNINNEASSVVTALIGT